MKTNADCTLYNRLCDPETRREGWRRTELMGVMWQDERTANVTERGLQSADSTVVFIPHDIENAALYVVPGLFPGKLEANWTLRDDSLLIRGICPDLEPPACARQIISVANNDFGSPALNHWEVHIK